MMSLIICLKEMMQEGVAAAIAKLTAANNKPRTSKSKQAEPPSDEAVLLSLVDIKQGDEPDPLLKDEQVQK
jgi:hypothetical protein